MGLATVGYRGDPAEDFQAEDLTATTATVTTLTATNVTVGSTALTATTTELNRVADVSARLVAGGGTLSATEALHDAREVMLDTAAGSVVSLPNATGSGTKIRFIVSVTATSNSHIVKVGRAADKMTGFINVHDQDGTAAAMYKGDGSADNGITMNRTTTGGIIGDWVECVDIKANLWWTNGILTCVAGSNVADPYSAVVS